MRYRIQVNAWAKFIPGYHDSFAMACNAAMEMSMCVPDTIISVYRKTSSGYWAEEVTYKNGE